MSGTSSSGKAPGNGNGAGDAPDPAPEYARTLAEIPRMTPEVMAHDGAPRWRGDDARALMCDASFLASRVEASRALYPMPEVADVDRHGRPGDERFHVQLWWYSILNSWLGPAVASIVVQARAPRPGWGGLTVFARDDYWLGFAADEFVDLGADDGLEPGDPGAAGAVRDYGRAVAETVAPVIDAICSATGIRPAPLWALTGDGLAGAAVGAGNEVMEPWAGALVGTWLVEGLSRVARVPEPRFVDVVPGAGADAVTPTDLAAAAEGDLADFDVVTHLERTSCCMIYRSPKADLCTSCPRRPEEERRRLWAGA